MKGTSSRVSGTAPKARHCMIAVVLTLAGCGSAWAQTNPVDDAVASCEDAADFAQSGDIDSAVEEARWCLEVLEQMKQDSTFAVFPDTQNDWIGGELENQSAMGMTLLSRTYQSGDRSIEVSVTTGPAGGGLAALAQLGASLGVGEGDKFRVQRRTVTDMGDSAEDAVHFMVELRSGGVMNVQSDSAAKSDVRRFLEDFPVADIDDALKG